MNPSWSWGVGKGLGEHPESHLWQVAVAPLPCLRKALDLSNVFGQLPLLAAGQYPRHVDHGRGGRVSLGQQLGTIHASQLREAMT